MLVRQSSAATEFSGSTRIVASSVQIDLLCSIKLIVSRSKRIQGHCSISVNTLHQHWKWEWQTFPVITIRTVFSVIIAPIPIIFPSVAFLFMIAVTIVGASGSIPFTISVAVSVAVSVTPIIVSVTPVIFAWGVISTSATRRRRAAAAGWRSFTTAWSITAGIETPGCRWGSASPLLSN